MKRLLAKSYPGSAVGAQPPSYALLTVHSRDVANACRTLADVAGESALIAAGFLSDDVPRFSRTLRACGWIQDVGKGNSHFQEMVTIHPTRAQLLRHEVISMVLFTRPQLCEWIKPLGDDALVAIWGAGGHHRKFSRQTVANECTEMIVLATHTDLRAILVEMALDLDLEIPPELERDLVIGTGRGDLIGSKALFGLKDQFEEAAERYATSLKRRFIGLVKAFGIAADVAASAIPRRISADTEVSAYVRETLAAGCLTASDLEELVQTWVRKNIASAVEFVPRTFQSDVAASSSELTLAEAGCGSGKSLAAYLWAKEWANRYSAEGRHPARLFFCLPTTGTATEHFKDYALEAGVPARLAHSRASIDREAIFIAATEAQEESANPDRERQTAEQRAAEADKIEALELWGTPVVVTTCDTILGLMANTLRALCSSPAILTGVIVFDEIHAFDDSMFGHLLVFLANFPHLPVLLMTASLQPSRRQALETIRPDLNVVPGPRDLEELPRYEIARIEARDTAADELGVVLNGNGKVLWVVNRVEDANTIYRRCAAAYPDHFVQVYHSRFRYQDRSRRHREVIDAFKKQDEAALLVATQVAEMSLDLSADLLITDLAPIPALIQRLGRLNRRATPENPGMPRRALITPVAVGHELPYARAELDSADDWLNELLGLGKAASQRDLSLAADQHQKISSFDMQRAEREAVFFSGVWATEVRPVRDEGHTISVILERDWHRWKGDGRGPTPDRDWLRRHEVSIPMRAPVLAWKERAGYLPIAPEDQISYCWSDGTEQGTGAAWRKS
jgi:CRISPR-associated endonuclease/helicase Cas3